YTGKTIGFIGGGNMGGAMINGLIQSRTLAPDQIIVSDVNADRLRELNANFGVQTSADNRAVAQEADFLIISVKPQVVRLILEPDDAATCELVMSIAAGVPILHLTETFNNPRLVRVMPNTPAMIGEGI